MVYVWYQTSSGRIASLGLPEAELPPDPELGHAESTAESVEDEEEDEVVDAFLRRDFPDSQMEMEWRRRGEETCEGEGPHTRSFRTENESGMSL